MGYRYYDKRRMAVSYPFGHGLSYTEFTYSGLIVDTSEWVSDGRVHASLSVKNTGRHAGKEVVQLYVGDIKSTVRRPVRELRGFTKLALETGEKKTATFLL